MILAIMTLGWIVGILLVNWKPGTGGIAPFLIVSGLLLAIVFRRFTNYRLAALCLLAAGLGAWRLTAAQPKITDADLVHYNDNGYAEMIGVVVDTPDVRDNDVQLRVEMEWIHQAGETKTIHGLALVTAPRFAGYQYGDRLRIQGTPITPPIFDTFSYRDYLAQRGIYTTVPISKITIEERGQGSPVFVALLAIREQSHLLITRLLPSPQSALLTGILLGDDNDIPPDVSDAFNQTGTTHIIAISGSNITIVAALLTALTGPMRNKRLSVLLIIAGIIIYTIFVGAGASVVRAAIMGGLALIAQRLGRRGDGITALAVSIWAMTAVNPYSLFDMGLILSASATLGLILYNKPLTEAAGTIAKRLFAESTAAKVVAVISDAVLITIAAQITTLPIIFLVFGRFSPVSFLTNMLIIPAQASIMAVGILMLVVGTVWVPLGQLLAWLVGIPIAYTIAVVQAMAKWPGASIPIAPEPSIIVLYYVMLFGGTMVLSQPTEVRQTLLSRLRKTASVPMITMLGLAIAGLLWAMVYSRPDGRLHVWFLAVGEGNAVLIQSPQGAHMLIDGGENPTQLRAAVGNLLPFFKRDIDMLIVTQPGEKTVSALPPLLDRYNVRMVMTNGQETSGEGYQALKTALVKQQTQIVRASAGYTVQSDDGVKLEIISLLPPTEATVDKSKPGDSDMILRLSYGDASFVLTSTPTEKAMQTALTTHIVRASVLQLAANGGEKENPPEWLKAISPVMAVVEAETGGAQPAENVIKALGEMPLFRTDQQGTIEVSTDGKQLWIRTDH